MSSPYELLAGLALLREKKRLTSYSSDKNLESWPALLVRMGDVVCVLRQNDVDEIIVRGKLNQVSGVADWLIGLGYFRGQLLNVIDGPNLLGFGGDVRLDMSAARIMVVSAEEEWFGLQVDELIGIQHVWSDNVEVSAPDGHKDGFWQAYIERWIKLEKNTVPVLQIKRLVAELERNGTLLLKNSK